MKKHSVLLLLGLLLMGCQSSSSGEPAAKTVESDVSNEVQPSPMGAGAGGMAPVQNAEAVTGSGGGGVQSAAKNAARRAAGQASGDGRPVAPD